MSHWPHQCLTVKAFTQKSSREAQALWKELYKRLPGLLLKAWRLKSTKSWGSKGPLNFYYIGHLNPKFHPFIFKTAETTFSLFLKMHFYFFLYFVSAFEIQNWRHSSGSGKGCQVAPPAASPPFHEKPPGGQHTNFNRAHYLKRHDCCSLNNILNWLIKEH